MHVFEKKFVSWFQNGGLHWQPFWKHKITISSKVRIRFSCTLHLNVFQILFRQNAFVFLWSFPFNWRPPVQEETFPMQVKEHDNNLHGNLWAFIRQTSVFNVQLLVILECVAVYVKIRKAQCVWCIVFLICFFRLISCSSFAFIRVISSIQGNFIYTNRGTSFCLCGPHLTNVLMWTHLFWNKTFFPNNGRKTQTLI